LVASRCEGVRGWGGRSVVVGRVVYTYGEEEEEEEECVNIKRGSKCVHYKMRFERKRDDQRTTVEFLRTSRPYMCVCAILFLALFFEYVQRCFVVVVVVFFFFFFFFARLVVT
jgi:hypothetical protein